ncbi:MAG: serine/threonine-protein kinase, partial [Myxococcota bacterium]
MIGEVLGGRYRLEAPLGEDSGVYRADDAEGKVPVAVKIFPSVGAHDTFRREAAIAMRARHPNLVGLLDAGVTGTHGWLVSEYVPGMEVRDRLREYGPMGVRRSLDVAAQLFAALDALHRRGLAHGDIKPDNVLLDEGRVRVFDYGMGRVPHAGDRGDGVYPGTLEYMHPTLFRGGLADARTDCFAAWATTFELLHGTPPYTVKMLRGPGPLPPPPTVGDAALDRLLAAGLDGTLGDARVSWLALTRFLRGQFDLPRVRPAPPIVPPEDARALLDHVRKGGSVGVVGPVEAGRAALEGLHHEHVRGGGWALWARADWGSAPKPLSDALSPTTAERENLK